MVMPVTDSVKDKVVRDMLVVKDLWLPVQFGNKRSDTIDATIWEVMHMKITAYCYGHDQIISRGENLP